MEAARVLRLHFCENDKAGDKPLWQAIVAKCRELQIAGATVFRGFEGFGEAGEIHRGNLVTHDQPIVVVIIDAADKIERLTPLLGEMIGTGVLAVSDAEVIRVQAKT